MVWEGGGLYAETMGQRDAKRETKLHRVCGWCRGTIEAGDPGAPVTHGICEVCAAEERRKMREKAA